MVGRIFPGEYKVQYPIIICNINVHVTVSDLKGERVLWKSRFDLVLPVL